MSLESYCEVVFVLKQTVLVCNFNFTFSRVVSDLISGMILFPELSQDGVLACLPTPVDCLILASSGEILSRRSRSSGEDVSGISLSCVEDISGRSRSCVHDLSERSRSLEEDISGRSRSNEEGISEKSRSVSEGENPSPKNNDETTTIVTKATVSLRLYTYRKTCNKRLASNKSRPLIGAGCTGTRTLKNASNYIPLINACIQ